MSDDKAMKSLIVSVKSVLGSVQNRQTVFTEQEIQREFQSQYEETIDSQQFGFRTLSDLLITDDCFTLTHGRKIKFTPSDKAGHIHDMIRNQNNRGKKRQSGGRGRGFPPSRNAQYDVFSHKSGIRGRGRSNMNVIPPRRPQFDSGYVKPFPITSTSNVPVPVLVPETTTQAESVKSARITVNEFIKEFHSLNKKHAGKKLSVLNYIQLLRDEKGEKVYDYITKRFNDGSGLSLDAFAKFLVANADDPNIHREGDFLEISGPMLQQGSHPSDVKVEVAVNRHRHLDYFPFTSAFTLKHHEPNGENIAVKVLHFQGPDRLYLSKVSDSDLVIDLSPNKPTTLSETETDLYVGMPCIWKHEGMPCRAVIMKLSTKNSMRLFLVDKALTFDKVAVQEVYNISEDLRAIPIQTLFCCIVGIKPKGQSTYSSYANRQMRLCLGEQLTVSFVHKVGNCFAISMPPCFQSLINDDVIEKTDEYNNLQHNAGSVGTSSIVDPQRSRTTSFTVKVIVLKSCHQLYIVNLFGKSYVPTGCISGILSHDEDKIIEQLDAFGLEIKNVKEIVSSELHSELKKCFCPFLPQEKSEAIFLVPFRGLLPLLKILPGEMFCKATVLNEIDEILRKG